MKNSAALFKHNSGHFLNSIYTSAKGAIRLAVLQRDLTPLLTEKPLSILDIGGGAGHMACWCASLGHQVTLIDISTALLEKAHQNAQSLNLADNITFIHANALSLEKHLDTQLFDGILCHAILEWVEQGEQLLKQCLKHLHIGGFFSLMFYNPLALEFIHHTYGNFDYIDNDFQAAKPAKLTPNHPRTMSWIDTQLISMQQITRSGIRCFYDYMNKRDRQRNTLENIIMHELTLSMREEFLPVSRYIHELRIKNSTV